MHDDKGAPSANEPTDNPTWADVLRELATFAEDRELRAPIAITMVADEPRRLSVTVGTLDHADWVAEFGENKQRHEAAHGIVQVTSNGELPHTLAWVELTAFLVPEVLAGPVR